MGYFRSALGPLLFLIHVNEEGALSLKSFPNLLADGTAMFNFYFCYENGKIIFLLFLETSHIPPREASEPVHNIDEKMGIWEVSTASFISVFNFRPVNENLQTNVVYCCVMEKEEKEVYTTISTYTE